MPSKSQQELAFYALLVVAFAALFARALWPRPAPEFVVAAPAAPASERPYYTERFAQTAGLTAYAHASTLTELGRDTPDGRLLAVWYAGSREGAGDVALYANTFDPHAGAWGEARVIVTVADTQRALRRYIRKLGNPVVTRAPDGRLWLFYVSVTVGGWSGSAINVSDSDDDGHSWSPARRLVTSPFFNVSTLVKGAPLFYRDGSIGLPVYHELMGKFGELLHLDAGGRLLDKVRMSWGHHSLQPSIAPLSARTALAALRNSGPRPRRVLQTRSGDGGRSWAALTDTVLPNPNAAVSLLRTHTGDLLLAFNNTEKDRFNLSLARSTDDGASWTVVHAFEHHPYAPHRLRFSYPYLIQTADGRFHMTYTWNQRRIKHIEFNRAWLETLKKWNR